jgi:predicted DNA-binding protein (UPF0251 family)
MPTERGSEGEADPGAAFDELLRVLSEQERPEVADALDISRPTFNRHVRAAERALFEVLFEGPA